MAYTPTPGESCRVSATLTAAKALLTRTRQQEGSLWTRSCRPATCMWHAKNQKKKTEIVRKTQSKNFKKIETKAVAKPRQNRTAWSGRSWHLNWLKTEDWSVCHKHDRQCRRQAGNCQLLPAAASFHCQVPVPRPP